MDERYFEIKIKHLHSELDAVSRWVKDKDNEAVRVYLEGIIKTAKELITKAE